MFELLTFLPKAVLSLSIFFAKVFLLLLNELNLLANLLVVLVVFNVEVVVEFLHLSQPPLLHFSHPPLVFVDLPAHLKHAFVPLLVLLEELLQLNLHLIDLLLEFLHL